MSKAPVPSSQLEGGTQPNGPRRGVDRQTSVSVAGVVLFGVVLAFDASLPPGYAGAMAYVVPVLLGLWTRGRAYTLLVASAASVTTLAVRLGVQPPPGVATSLVWMNRLTALIAIWAVAVVVLRYKVIRAAVDDERRAHERSRDVLLKSLEEKNIELERFTYTVSHDLKSPLVTIKGFLGLVMRSVEQGEPARVKADLARIEVAADRMGQLLDELLELSRIGRVVGPLVEVPLRTLLQEVREALAGLLAARGVTLEAAGELVVVPGDPLRLRQVLQNLVENAAKFTGDQPSPRITVGSERRGDEVLVWVQDNGAGVDPRYAEKIFGLFEQLEKKSPGTGVGLALVRRIAEVHGGRAWVESEGLGRGSRFCFTLRAGYGGTT